MFSFIAINSQGNSLTDIRAIVEFIAAETSRTELNVRAVHDNTWCAHRRQDQ